MNEPFILYEVFGNLDIPGDIVEKKNLESILCKCGGPIKITDTELGIYRRDVWFQLTCQSCLGTYAAVPYTGPIPKELKNETSQ